MNQGRYATSMVPVSILFSTFALPAAGLGQVTTDVYLFTPSDNAIDRVFLHIDGTVVNPGVGSAKLRLVQRMRDGRDTDLTKAYAFVGTEVNSVELTLAERMEGGRPVYLRAVGSSPSTTGTPWYASSGIRLNGTIHIVVDTEQP